MRGCARPGIAVDVGIGADAARRDHAGHIRRMRDGRPHVMLKLAISADGKAAAGRGGGPKPVAITGEAVRDRVHLLRAQNDAIMIGIGTALADDPHADLPLARHGEGLAGARRARQRAAAAARFAPRPDRARDAGLGRLPDRRPPPAAEEALWRQGVEVLRAARMAAGSILRASLTLLAGRGITRLMVEGGPTLAAALIAADLVDEAILFHSAKSRRCRRASTPWTAGRWPR